MVDCQTVASPGPGKTGHPPPAARKTTIQFISRAQLLMQDCIGLTPKQPKHNIPAHLESLELLLPLCGCRGGGRETVALHRWRTVDLDRCRTMMVSTTVGGRRTGCVTVTNWALGHCRHLKSETEQRSQLCGASVRLSKQNYYLLYSNTIYIYIYI